MNFSLTGIFFAIIALVAGALVPLQAASNAELGRALGHPLWATVVSLLVSVLIAIPVILAMRVPAPILNQMGQLPMWVWLGGIAGVIYITSALILVPRLGATRFIVCVIAGQMLISLILDQYGFMNLPMKEINAGRLVGVTFVLLGMIMVLWLTPSSPNLGDVKASMTGNLNDIESTPTSNAKPVSHFES